MPITPSRGPARQLRARQSTLPTIYESPSKERRGKKRKAPTALESQPKRQNTKEKLPEISDSGGLQQRDIYKAPQGTKRKSSPDLLSRPKRHCKRRYETRGNITRKNYQESAERILGGPAGDEMDIDPPEVHLDHDKYITVVTPDGERVRKRRARSHHFIRRFDIPSNILNALDDDPTWTLQEFQRRFRLVMRVGVSDRMKSKCVVRMLWERARSAFPDRFTKGLEDMFEYKIGIAGEGDDTMQMY